MLSRVESSGWRKHLDGWQAGAVLLLLAGSAILLAVPRAVAPQSLPLPNVAQPALQSVLRADEDRARRASSEPLDVDVRALGRELRAYNSHAHAGEQREMVAARRRITKAAGKALRQGTEPLLALRAYQTLRFVEEVRRWTDSGERSDELAALGGDFIAMLSRHRWCEPSTRKLLMSEAVLRAFYKKRWNDISSLALPELALSLDEDRLRYRFLLHHPMIRYPNSWPHSDPEVVNMRAHRARLATIDRLARRDPDYPADLGRGVVSFWMSRHAQATEHFRRHLTAHPDGPHALRARNYLKAALDRTIETM